MCVICSENISSETRKNQLEKLHNDIITDNRPEIFETFNTTSVLLLLYSCTGSHGDECKQMSIRIMRQFILWIRKTKTELYLPKSGIDVMFHSAILEEIVDCCDINSICPTNKNDSSENRPEAIHEKLKPLFVKMEEAHNNLMNNDLVYYIRKNI